MVVARIAIAVMNVFPRTQRPTDFLFRHDAVLVTTASLDVACAPAHDFVPSPAASRSSMYFASTGNGTSSLRSA
jgi:hypothetical protein